MINTYHLHLSDTEIGLVQELVNAGRLGHDYISNVDVDHAVLEAVQAKLIYAASHPGKTAPRKGELNSTDLGRRGWNRTLTTKARLAGGDTYHRLVKELWPQAVELREQGVTPDEAFVKLGLAPS